MITKNVSKFSILDATENDVSVAFWYEDGTKEILVLTLKAAQNLVQQARQAAKAPKN